MIKEPIKSLTETALKVLSLPALFREQPPDDRKSPFQRKGGQFGHEVTGTRVICSSHSDVEAADP